MMIYPLVKRWTPSTLRRVSITQLLNIFINIILLLVSTVWYTHNTSAKCLFASDCFSPLPIDSPWIEIPIQFIRIAFEFLVTIAMMELVCAQAPYNRRGMLFGILCSVSLASASLGFGVYMAWKLGYQKEAADSPSCIVWFYLFTTITTTLGYVVWCVVAKKYKNRERDEPERYRIFIEDYYDRYCCFQSP